MTVQCTDCNKVIEDGRANLPIGVKCSSCSDKYYDDMSWFINKIPAITPEDTALLKSIFKDGVTDIGGHLIPNTLLNDYMNHVNYLRRVCDTSLSLGDPITLFITLKEREKIHRQIFEQTGLTYHADYNASNESIQFNTALDSYITI